MPNWRNVQPGNNQVAIALMRDDDLALQLVSLDLEYLDHQGWHVRLHQKPQQLFARWHWRRNVKA